MYEENNGGISQSADYGDDWDNEGAPNTGDNALIIHKDKLFSGYHRNTANNNVTGVWFRQNKTGSPSWTNIPGPIINSVSANLDISCIAMATNNDNVMYIASTKDGTDGHSTVWRTDNIQSSSPTWISVGSGLPVTNRSVASIVVDPNNANHLWAFMGQFDDDPSSPQRAFFSSDGGAHWNNASSGLGGNNDFPANYAVYQDGTTDAIYLGTDIGVFFNPHASDPNSSWVCYNRNLPVGIARCLRIDYCNNLLLASIYGYGFWEAPLAVSASVPVQITSSQTWNSTTISHTNLEINPGVTLTLTANLEMANGTSITVDPGAALIVDGLNKTDETGGKITDICGSSWDGIYVAGNSSQLQTAANQGQLILKNNAVLDNARTAIHTYKETASGDIDWTTTGAIIQATNTTFRNNRRDAEFLTYRPGLAVKKETRNLSYFNLCKFLTDDNCPTPGDQLAPYVTMFEANGVAFNGCTFRDDRTNISDVGRIGIYAIRSGLLVNWYCTDTRGTIYNCFGTSTPSTFTNLKFGIEAQSLSNPALTVNVTNSTFTDCHVGIHLSSIDNSKLNLCTFNVPIEPISARDNPSGILLETCKGYQVEDNTMLSTVGVPTSEAAVGLVIKSGNDANTNYYHNQFRGLTVGSESINQNKAPGANAPGLQFLCNTYTNNGQDIFITSDPGFTGTIGMASNQGAANHPAGNLFGNNSPILIRNVTNNGDGITYFNSDATNNWLNLRIPKASLGIFKPVFAKNTDNCVDKILGVNLLPTMSGLSNLATNIMDVKIGKMGKTDGGNTSGTINNIKCGSCNANDVYNNLMTISPWLSEDALVATASDQSILTPTMITNVMVANPQSARSTLVQTTLDNRMQPLTQQMRDQINAVQDVYTACDTLLDSLAYMEYQLHDGTDQLLINDLDSADTITTISSLLLLAHEQEYDYRLAELYFGSGDAVNANQVLQQLPSRYTVEPVDQAYLTEFSNYYNTIYNWEQAGKDMSKLSSTDIGTLSQYALSEDNIGYAANALLAYNNSSTYTPPVYIPADGQTMPNTIQTGLKNSQPVRTSYFDIYPNPANDQVTIRYNANTSDNEFIVMDLAGRVLLHQKLEAIQGQVFVDTRQLPAGQYVCKLYSKKNIVGIKKLSILK